MTESKTIRMKRKPAHSHHFQSTDELGLVELILGGQYCESDELNITITPVKSREERLREARAAALYRELDIGELGRRAIAIIERVDAEFAKGEGDGG